MAERTFISFDWAIKKVLRHKVKGMTEAKEVLRYENMKPEDQIAYKRHIENRRVEMGVVGTAIDKAKRERSIEVAKKLLEANSSIDFVVQMTDLLKSEVERLANNEDIDIDKDE